MTALNKFINSTLCAALALCLTSPSVSALAAVTASGATPAWSTDVAGAQVNAPGLPPLCAWLPASAPKAVLLCVHGLGLHMGSYRPLGETLSKDGLGVYALDARGFGTWFVQGSDKIDFDGTLADIGKTLTYIHEKHPGIPVYLLGESMGGAIALQAAARYPDQIRGLICSVPSGDRKSGLASDMHVGLRVIAGGFEQRFDVGKLVISYATQNEEHRRLWESDPRSRKMYSPAELLTFQHFMDKNFAAADKLATMPVLFMQGTNDRLVRGSGTWDVYDHVASPNKRIALSMAGEHLIYENGQCRPEDLQYTLNWIDSVAAGKFDSNPSLGVGAPPAAPSELTQAQKDEQLKQLASAPQNTPGLIRRNSDISYWIELKRGGQTFRCSNKMDFKSGDEIRFHLSSASDGYAYIYMEQGSTGARAMLFPEQITGTDNTLKANADCAIPTRTYLKFDENPGIERVNLVFSRKPIDIDKVISDPNTVTAYVSPDKSGAKDLVPTRMQIAWNDSNPVLMPGFGNAGHEQLAVRQDDNNIVRVAAHNSQDVIALHIALEHK